VQIGHRQLGHAPGDRFLALIHFHFSYGLEEPMVTLAGGGTVVIPRLPVSVAELCAVIDREDVTRVAITPTLASDLLPSLVDEKPRFPGIRRFSISTMFTPETLRRELRRRVTTNLVICYGTNELWYITAPMSPRSSGFPRPRIFRRRRRGRDRRRPGPAAAARPGRAGPPARIDPAGGLSRRSRRDGQGLSRRLVLSGDLGVLSAEGALFLKGRADDMINCDGIKIYPAEIELRCSAIPTWRRRRPFPLTIAAHREIPAAAVVRRGDATSDELVAFCRTRSASAPRG